MAAYTSGRATVSRYDCLLLQHVLWQRPDEAPRIADWLVARLAVGDSLASLDYSFSGALRHARLTRAASRVTHQNLYPRFITRRAAAALVAAMQRHLAGGAQLLKQMRAGLRLNSMAAHVA